MSAARGRGTDAGFTLIEVLVALAVLSIALVGVIGAVNAYVDSTGGLRARMAAHWAAMNAVEAARLDPAGLADSRSEEEIGGLRWTVETTVEETQLPGMVKVTASASSPTAAGAIVAAYIKLPEPDQ